MCGDAMDVVNGQPTGCIRLSFGYMSTIDDADAFIRFISDNFIDKTTPLINNHVIDDIGVSTPASWKVANIYIYPVKSAGALEVSSKCICLL